MHELHSLIHSLTSSEWQALQVFLTAFTPRNADNLKYLRLAKMLMEAKDPPTPEACCLKIYGKKKDTGFGMLKSRLKEKVFDFLVTDISTDKKQELDESDYIAIKIKKRSALFQQLYYSKKRIPSLYNLLDEIIHLAKDYEYYPIVVEHLKFKKNVVTWKKGKDAFEKINKEMEYYSECNRMVNKSENLYYRLSLHTEYSSKPDNEKLSSILENSIAELVKYYEQTKSPQIKYHLKFLELGFYQHKENFLKARSVCLELLEVVRNNKSVYRRQRVSIVHCNLSRCEYYLSHYEKAAIYAREAQKHFNLNSENYCIAIEQEFYALFAFKKYDGAFELASKMLVSAPKKELGEFRYAKYNFLLANALFQLGRYKEVISILSKGLEISQDKAGWEIGVRVLTIMAYIEMKKFSEASFSIERLRKFIAFTDKKTPVSVRDKTILQLLKLMEKKEFGPISSFPKEEEGENFFKKLGKWEPFTHEVIPFHEWVEGKIKM